MKICIIISSDEWRATAGVRIRYMRMQPALKKNGHTLELKTISSFSLAQAQGVDFDVYVFTKTHDVQSVILARMLRAQGRRVGIDMFDDYYSQVTDSRFVHLRRWFAMILPALDFAMCSTRNMSMRLARLAPNLPCQIMNDPFGTFDADTVGYNIAHNREVALREKRLRIGWFGIGDSPYFSLGLDDLFAFSGELLGARRAGYEIKLEILTNPRALTAQRMEMLARLPVPFTLEHWSEERESALIARSVACFLPVNAQGFSVVKSLNRGGSTLVGGSQILSVGFPLYDVLDKFVYRNIGTLIGDLENDSLRLRADTTAQLATLIETYGTADHEAQKLVTFLEQVPTVAVHTWPAPDSVVAVMHGLTPVGNVHKAVQRFGILSVASTHSMRSLNFDVAVAPGGGCSGLEVLMSERAWSKLRQIWQQRAKIIGKFDNKGPIYKLILSTTEMSFEEDIDPVTLPVRPLDEMVRYANETARTRNLLKLLFHDPLIFLAENKSPYCDSTDGVPALPGDLSTPLRDTARPKAGENR